MNIVLEIDQSTDIADITALCIEASHVDIHPGNDKLSRPVFSMLRGLVFSGTRYNDHGAACSCAKMRVYRFGDHGYTKCDQHGFQSIGTLRREIGKKAAK